MAGERGSLSDDLFEGIVSLVPIVGPLVSPFSKRLSRAMRAEHARNFSIAVQAAERMAGLSREDLAEAIEDDPRLVPLVTRLLFAAGMTGQETLRLMGAALGEALRVPTHAGHDHSHQAQRPHRQPVRRSLLAYDH